MSQTQHRKVVKGAKYRIVGSKKKSNRRIIVISRFDKGDAIH